MIPKFRAWDSVKKKFVEHFFITDNGLICNMEKPTSGYNSPIPIEKSELILMQSTGLKDKNGKEIFEGDVIAIEVDDTGMPINAKVFQNSKIGVLMFHVFEDNEDVPMVELLEDHSVAFEIIGNIYENPELLEVE
jgi:hypothetical protein